MFPVLAVAVLMVAEILLRCCAGLEIRTSIAFAGRQRAGQVCTNVMYAVPLSVPYVDVVLFLAQNEPRCDPSVVA